MKNLPHLPALRPGRSVLLFEDVDEVPDREGEGGLLSEVISPVAVEGMAGSVGISIREPSARLAGDVLAGGCR